MTNLLIDAGLATDLNNIDLESTPPAADRKRFGIIYALYEHGKLVKIGITTDVAERKKEYREHYKKHYEEIDFDRDCKLIELVAFDGIPLEAEQKLTAVLCRFLDSIIANPTTPQGMRLFVVELRERGWHRGVSIETAETAGATTIETAGAAGAKTIETAETAGATTIVETAGATILEAEEAGGD